MSRSFGLDAPSALEALRATAERFRDDDLNADLARDCAGKAWHLCDHVLRALGRTSEFETLNELQEHAREACPELGYLQDICIESKHGEIARYRPRIEEARVRVGDFSREDFCSDDFDTSRLEVVLRRGQRISFNQLIDRAVEFWTVFMEARGIR